MANNRLHSTFFVTSVNLKLVDTTTTIIPVMTGRKWKPLEAWTIFRTLDAATVNPEIRIGGADHLGGSDFFSASTVLDRNKGQNVIMPIPLSVAYVSNIGNFLFYVYVNVAGAGTTLLGDVFVRGEIH